MINLSYSPDPYVTNRQFSHAVATSDVDFVERFAHQPQNLWMMIRAISSYRTHLVSELEIAETALAKLLQATDTLADQCGAAPTVSFKPD